MHQVFFIDDYLSGKVDNTEMWPNDPATDGLRYSTTARRQRQLISLSGKADRDE